MFDPAQEITICVHATLNTYYVTEQRGYDDWERVAASPYFDVFSTTIVSWELPEPFFRSIAERTAAVAKKYNKQSERWLMGYYRQPDDFAQIDRMTDLYESLGIDRAGRVDLSRRFRNPGWRRRTRSASGTASAGTTNAS